MRVVIIGEGHKCGVGGLMCRRLEAQHCFLTSLWCQWAGEGRQGKGDEQIMARLLTYLLGLPHHGSPIMFPYPPSTGTPSRNLSTSRKGGLHPSLEGRG